MQGKTATQAPAVPKKNLLCCDMLRHASSRRWGVPNFLKAANVAKTQNQTQRNASPNTLQR